MLNESELASLCIIYFFKLAKYKLPRFRFFQQKKQLYNLNVSRKFLIPILSLCSYHVTYAF